MLIEDVELTLSHVGLDELRERTLLPLFASAQAHVLTAGTGHTLTGVTDADGARLYPAYLWLHLRVPPERPLGRFRLWDRVAVGVHVQRYGRMMLESTYVLGAPGELAPTIDGWNLGLLPSMRAASAWVVDGRSGEPQPAPPKAGAIVELPSSKSAPPAVAESRVIRAAGKLRSEPRRWATTSPIVHRIRDRRDVAPDHNLMFATYLELMDLALDSLLGEQMWPAMPRPVLACRTLLEREVYFLAHSGGGKQVLVDVRASLLPCAGDLHGADRDVVSAGILETDYELYEAGSHVLLAVARAKELFLIPRSRSALVADLARFMPPGG